MCDVEILWLADKLGYRVREVGITWRDDGDSRLELVRGNLRNMQDLFRIRFGRYTAQPYPVDQPTPAVPLVPTQLDS
jgi:hypothetical protein